MYWLRSFIVLFALLAPVQAQVSQTGAGKATPGGAPALPTLTGGAAAVNASCGFASSCNITTTGAVTAGEVVVIVGVNNQGVGAGAISAISVCGTSLTVDVAPSIPTGQYGAAMGHGTTAGGGSCTIAITIGGTGNIENGGAAWVTLNNLSSTTPGTACQAAFNFSQNAPYECAGGLTVSANGFGIVGIFSGGLVAATAAGSVTLDGAAINSGGTASVVGIGHVTATCTAAQCAMNAGNFAQAAVIGQPFR